MTDVSRRTLLVGTAAATAIAAVPGLASLPAAESVPPPPGPLLRAFEVLETDEWTGSIFFAETEAEARDLGAAEHADGEIGCVECRRVEWADRFAATGDVPASEAVAHGWYFECYGCGRRVADEWDGEEDEEPPSLDDILGSMQGRIFCSAKCKARYEARQKEIEVAGAAMIEALKRTVIARFGPVDFDENASRLRPHVYAYHHDGACIVQQAIIRFCFPGQKIDSAQYRIDPPDQVREGRRWVDPVGPFLPEISVCSGDAAAFNAWVGREVFKIPALLAEARA